MTVDVIGEVTSRSFLSDVEVFAQPTLRRLFHDREAVMQIWSRPRCAGWMGPHCTCEIFELETASRKTEAFITDEC
jgi:hypothetical protein